jgi:nitronate monooxygenase
VILSELHIPIVLAPLAGGPTTPQLAAAVSNAGGLGFLAAGYLSADQLHGQLDQARELTGAPLGVNVFVPGSASSPAAVAEYAAAIAADARGAGVELGLARFDDDDCAAKLALLTADPPPVTSFTFGCPDPAVVEACRQPAARSGSLSRRRPKPRWQPQPGLTLWLFKAAKLAGIVAASPTTPRMIPAAGSACCRCFS